MDLKPSASGRLEHPQGLLFRLDAVDGLLHPRIEVLYPQTDAVEAELPQQCDGVGLDLPRVDLDGVLTAIVIMQTESIRGFLPSARVISSWLMNVGVPPPQCS